MIKFAKVVIFWLYDKTVLVLSVFSSTGSTDKIIFPPSWWSAEQYYLSFSLMELIRTTCFFTLTSFSKKCASWIVHRVFECLDHLGYPNCVTKNYCNRNFKKIGQTSRYFYDRNLFPCSHCFPQFSFLRLKVQLRQKQSQ